MRYSPDLGGEISTNGSGFAGGAQIGCDYEPPPAGGCLASEWPLADIAGCLGDVRFAHESGQRRTVLKPQVELLRCRHARRYPMVKVFATRLNCFPMYAEKADDAALTLPICLPLPKSWAPCRVMFSGGLLPRKNSVTHSWAVFCSVVPQLTRFTLE